MPSPYAELHSDEWLPVTHKLINAHPLTLDLIREIAIETWDLLWQTRIGDGESAINLSEVDVPATVVGYFFEKLFAKNLSNRFPGKWRGQKAKDEKDLVFEPDRAFDTEVKSSGQLGTKIFGNRSYGKKGADESQASKVEKSGYYITVNFHGTALILLRFGWIDFEDWKSQKSETGQAATLSDEAYRYKLVEIRGDYRRKAPVGILPKVGPKAVNDFAKEGVRTIEDVLTYRGTNSTIHRIKEAAATYTDQ